MPVGSSVEDFPGSFKSLAATVHSGGDWTEIRTCLVAMLSNILAGLYRFPRIAIETAPTSNSWTEKILLLKN